MPEQVRKEYIYIIIYIYICVCVQLSTYIYMLQGLGVNNGLVSRDVKALGVWLAASKFKDAGFTC